MAFWLEWLVFILWAVVGTVMGLFRLQYREFPLFFIVLLIITGLALWAMAFIRKRYRNNVDG